MRYSCHRNFFVSWEVDKNQNSTLSLILLEPWIASVDTDQITSVTWSQFRYAKKIGKVTGRIYLYTLVKIINMMIFHVLDSFCKSVPWAFVAVVLNHFVLWENVQSWVRAK